MPTGTTYTPHPGAPYSGTLNFSGLENVLPNGDDYRRYEVQEMMRLLWEEYVAANPRLFEVHD
jgi:hypothetical protein